MTIRTTSLAIIVLLLATLLAARSIAGAGCRSTCTQDIRACRARCRETADRRACRKQCADASTCTAPGARLRTVACTVNDCRDDATGFPFRERLVVRRGNCDPVTLIELPPVGPIPDPLHLCSLYGRIRIGSAGVVVGRLQRLAVTPDATGLLIEITNDHSLFRNLSPDPPEEGIFYLRTDGRNLPDGRLSIELARPTDGVRDRRTGRKIQDGDRRAVASSDLQRLMDRAPSRRVGPAHRVHVRERPDRGAAADPRHVSRHTLLSVPWRPWQRSATQRAVSALHERTQSLAAAALVANVATRSHAGITL